MKPVAASNGTIPVATISTIYYNATLIFLKLNKFLLYAQLFFGLFWVQSRKLLSSTSAHGGEFEYKSGTLA